ncbi:MAG: alpha/beta hydrolase [Candidatus Aminicenantes bacterium]|nr:alpha/beta hydrolase [Candidatus Aminicenantes bacterium]
MKKHTNNFVLMWIFFVIVSVFCFSCRKKTDVGKKIPPIDVEVLKSHLNLETEEDLLIGGKISSGTFTVFEDRNSQNGRTISLSVVILHAFSETPKPDPFFPLAGGPGGDVTRNVNGYKKSWIREERDIVFVSQRGTGGDNRLDCELAASDENLQGYLDPLFNLDNFRACLEELQKKFDLTLYSTCLAADDLNDLRLALEYDKINLTGGSYGTRAALVYMRRHPETVRSAILNGVLPLANKNPLFHSSSAQEAIQLLLDGCFGDPACRFAFPNLEEEFLTVLERLDEEPADVLIDHPVTEERVLVNLDRVSFTEALRTMLYSYDRNRQVPYLIHQAFLGDYEPFAATAIQSNRNIRRSLALGMLLSVTCGEDLSRVNDEEIVRFTQGTYLGANRIRQQMAVCEFWPKSNIPDSFGDPVEVDVPTLLLSGTMDPVTPPIWGTEAASHLPNGLHIVVPGAHGVGGDCIRLIEKQFLESGSIENLDISCIDFIESILFKIRENS